jgi:hypothetical protein
LAGRAAECATLDGMLAAARAGRSGVLVLRGEAGIGKSALLEYAAERAHECRVLRAVGVEWEMELPFAGLHQLCAELLDGRARLPEPQGDAIATAFGINAGPRPDRFLVGLAVLSLLSDAGEEHPLVCLVDDVQWLDRSSAQVLAFVARRLAAESVVLLFAERDSRPLEELAGLPELRVAGLADGSARELLASVLNAPLDERVRARILAETRGNPLALLELPRDVSAEGFAGGFEVPGDRSLPGRIEASFRRRVEQLPAETQRPVAPRGGRSDRRARAASSRLGGDRRADRQAVSRRGRQPGRGRPAGHVPPPASALRDLPGGAVRRATCHASGAGGGH